MRSQFLFGPVLILVFFWLFLEPGAMRSIETFAPQQAEEKRLRIIRFGGYRWVVKEGERLPPANNNWADDPRSVWIGTDGKLHLEIRKVGDVWYSAQITSQRFASYGIHRFYIQSPVNDLSANVVLGLFLYADDHNEIDIEFKREVGSEHNAQYAIQPSHLSDYRHTFLLEYAGPTIHEIDWQPDYVAFRTLAGDDPSAGRVLQEWRFERQSIPREDKQLQINMNLWLRNPSAQVEPIKVIISDFETQYCP